MAFQSLELKTGRSIAQHNRSIMSAGHHHSAIGAEIDAINSALTGITGPDQAAIGNIPELNRSIIGG